MHWSGHEHSATAPRREFSRQEPSAPKYPPPLPMTRSSWETNVISIGLTLPEGLATGEDERRFALRSVLSEVEPLKFYFQLLYRLGMVTEDEGNLLAELLSGSAFELCWMREFIWFRSILNVGELEQTGAVSSAGATNDILSCTCVRETSRLITVRGGRGNTAQRICTPIPLILET